MSDSIAKKIISLAVRTLLHSVHQTKIFSNQIYVDNHVIGLGYNARPFLEEYFKERGIRFKLPPKKDILGRYGDED